MSSTFQVLLMLLCVHVMCIVIRFDSMQNMQNRLAKDSNQTINHPCCCSRYSTSTITVCLNHIYIHYFASLQSPTLQGCKHMSVNCQWHLIHTNGNSKSDIARWPDITQIRECLGVLGMGICFFFSKKWCQRVKNSISFLLLFLLSFLSDASEIRQENHLGCTKPGK